MRREGPRFSKPEDFFEEITQEIILTSSASDKTRILPTDLPTDFADQPTKIEILNEDRETRNRLPDIIEELENKVPKPEKDPLPEYSDSELYQRPSRQENKLAADLARKLTIAKKLSMVVEQQGKKILSPLLKISPKQFLVISSSLVFLFLALMLWSRASKRITLPPINSATNSAASNPWKVNLERPWLDIHPKLDDWTEVERDFDTAFAELDR